MVVTGVNCIQGESLRMRKWGSRAMMVNFTLWGRALSVAALTVKNKYQRRKKRRKTRDYVEVSIMW